MSEETEKSPEELEAQLGEEMHLVVRGTVRLLLPFILIFGFYIISYGHLTPGGGFQGGMILVGAGMAIHLAYGYVFLRRFDQEQLDLIEHTGLVIFLFIGSLGMVLGHGFLDNWLSPGRVGSLWSAGTIPLLNFTVAFKVASGTLIVLLILVQALKKGED